MRRDAGAAPSLYDPDDPNRYQEVRGSVVDIIEEGGDAHFDSLASRYPGVDTCPNRRPGEIRVIDRIARERFTRMG